MGSELHIELFGSSVPIVTVGASKISITTVSISGGQFPCEIALFSSEYTPGIIGG